MADIEKVSINLSVVDLGQIDLLVDQGFYSSRTDFFRAAVRTQLGNHDEAIKQAVVRTSSVLGVISFDREDLQRMQHNNEQARIVVVGLLILNNDISPELAQATIKSIKVYGALRASPAVKAALADRMS
ncbi:CopG family transcriptional regulator [Herpetosiphon llansteffanensis]|uniref:CopG family transcriptional regulator n=1 Tax=Herpetosiphon llansteffanensis TaxID=2094568 RepID=UPI000D7CE849|nr:CopG family transcriptional regulator [Herpetosiphon llansteffanensis]